MIYDCISNDKNTLQIAVHETQPLANQIKEFIKSQKQYCKDF